MTPANKIVDREWMGCLEFEMIITKIQCFPLRIPLKPGRSDASAWEDSRPQDDTNTGADIRTLTLSIALVR
jgi:hypothetical protein